MQTGALTQSLWVCCRDVDSRRRVAELGSGQKRRLEHSREVYATVQVKKLQEQQLKPKEQVTLEPYERDHAMVVGVFRPPPKVKA